MADRLLDVWILQANAVYRDVPYTVVTDWLQQGRLVAEDRVRPRGGKSWFPFNQVAAFQPFLPQAAPVQVEDRAEALEAVDLGLRGIRRVEEEDEDVDMIPLIDISLVLLIFFMMTASVSSGFLSLINTPAAQHQTAAIATGMYWVGVEGKSRAGAVEKDEKTGVPLPWYSFGKDTQELVPPGTYQKDVSFQAAIAKILADQEGEVRIRLRADKLLPIETINQVTRDLQQLETAKRKIVIFGEVSDPSK